MKKTKFFLSGLAGSMLLGSGMAYAGDPNLPACEGEELHCASTPVAQPPLNEGKWIKILFKAGEITDETPSVCQKEFGIALSPDQEFFVEPGNSIAITLRFEQCNDQNCAESRSLGIDNFVLSQSLEGLLTTNPKTFQIQPVDMQYGETCQVDYSNDASSPALKSFKAEKPLKKIAIPMGKFLISVNKDKNKS